LWQARVGRGDDVQELAAKRARTRRIVTVFLVLVTLLTGVAVTLRLRLDPNVAALLPERGESAALRTYLRAFGGSDLAMVLVSANEPGGDAERAAVADAAEGIARELAELGSVRYAAAGLDTHGELDPMLAWRHADASARAKLAQAMTPEGMRARLHGSRTMLVMPGSGEAAERITRDPLRLWQVVAESRAMGSGFHTQANGAFASDDGLARLVLVFPRGQALRGEDARRFVAEAEGVLERWRARHPELAIGLTGGHAIGAATEHMLEGDLMMSGTFSMVLASLAFVLVFRRVRALVAVMPPLVLGTLWTAGVAAALPTGLSAIAVAFMSVVIGVGVDTGVHVYSALLESRRQGLAPRDAARRARELTTRPVLVAAVTAAAAFASLALSEIGALRQLGILCAGGEVLTAIAIVLVTPEIGAWLERGKPPVESGAGWTKLVAKLTAGRKRALACLAIAALPLVAIAAGHVPYLADAVVALRPAGLPPLVVQDRIYARFGGRPGQWVVLVSDRDYARARERADHVAEELSTIPEHLDSLDAVTTVAPAEATQEKRLAERDALDLPARAVDFEAALRAEGFAPARFEHQIAAMRAPPHDLVALADLEKDDRAIMLSRYLGEDGPEHVVVIYLLPKLSLEPGAEAVNRAHEVAIEQAVHAADPQATITGYGRLERALRASLLVDLPRVGLCAALLVIVALVLSLRRPRDVLLAAAVVVVEIAIVLFLIRLLRVPLHAYDALVLPVLLGITVDEAMFLLYRARASNDDVEEILRHEGPPIAATALTTAAGFGGLVLCDFDGLRHLGMVGALGSLTGLVVAVVIVPAGLRLRR
jgi:uncharacterized protein